MLKKVLMATLVGMPFVWAAAGFIGLQSPAYAEVPASMVVNEFLSAQK